MITLKLVALNFLQMYPGKEDDFNALDTKGTTLDTKGTTLDTKGTTLKEDIIFCESIGCVKKDDGSG